MQKLFVWSHIKNLLFKIKEPVVSKSKSLFKTVFPLLPLSRF